MSVTAIETMSRGLRAAGLAGGLALAMAGPAAAAPGDHDRTFSGDGVLFDRFSELEFTPRAAALQRDGKVVVAGEDGSTNLVVARYLPDGRRDASFGANGFRSLALASAELETSVGANSVAIDTTGRIVVGGSIKPPWRDAPPDDSLFLLARLLPDGRLDPAFSGDGLATVDFPYSDGPDADDGDNTAATDLAVQRSGRITAAGVTDRGHIGIARLTASGAPDSSFSGNGKAEIETRLGRVSGYWSVALALRRSGRIVLAGEPADIANTDIAPDEEFQYEVRHDFGLVQLHPDGRLDRRFGRGGKVRTSFTRRGNRAVERATDLTLDRRGRVVVVGEVVSKRSPHMIGVARYWPQGRLDRSFSGNGILTTRVSDAACCVIMQRDGKVVVGGDSGGQPTLVRYTRRGRRDRSFGRRGVRRTRVGVERVVGLLPRPDSRLWLVGAAAGRGVMFARYWLR